MGCRTRANEYYEAINTPQPVQMNRDSHHTGSYVGGNVVRKINESPRYKKTKIKRHSKRAASAKQSRALVRQTRAFVVLGTAAAAFFVFICLTLLIEIDNNNVLTKKINSMESEIQDITNQNDAREYEIDSSVDLNYVIDVATEQLGMVRSSSSQIRYYSENQSEYLQQVAEVPKE